MLSQLAGAGVSALTGNGLGGFAAPLTIATSDSGAFIVAAGFNNDARSISL